jgi:hypothetical protein
MTMKANSASRAFLPRAHPPGISSFASLAIVLFILGFPGTAPGQSLDGYWRSQGYGFVFEINGPDLKAYEVTTSTCLPSFTARRDSAAVADREATFTTKDGEVFFTKLGGSTDHKLLHNDGSASDMRIDRIPRLPAVCVRLTPNTPSDNFEVFSRTWSEHYISFDQKKTDWSKVVEANRSKVTAQTTPAELFNLLQGMISSFNDAHTFLEAPELQRKVRSLRSGTDRVVKGGFETFQNKGIPALLGVTDQAYLKGPLRKWCNEQIQYGYIDDTTGYLRILSFGNYVKDDAFAAGLAALESALDEIFSDSKLKGLVIDVRINLGGFDPYGLAIAARLANKEYLAYTKEARADPVDQNKWTPGDPSLVRPGTRPGFKGPVVELIGPLTISAGETFTQAMMGRTPHVIRIGENTQGVFSDVLTRSLPNGWRFGLPNEVFRTPQGKTFDGSGIPPDIAVAVFADSDVTAGKDPALAKALELLWKK